MSVSGTSVKESDAESTSVWGASSGRDDTGPALDDLKGLRISDDDTSVPAARMQVDGAGLGAAQPTAVTVESARRRERRNDLQTSMGESSGEERRSRLLQEGFI
ncbi:MAG: hypothetical protein SGCHY_001827, partial [Lobulomycetales sp.]